MTLQTDLETAVAQVTADSQKLTLIDKTDPNKAIRLASGDHLGVTHHVDQQSMVIAEYTDF